MQDKTKKIIIGFTIMIIITLVFVLGTTNKRLQEKNVKILFEDQNIIGTNIGPGECIFDLEGEKYLLSINTKYFLKYVDMDTLKTEHKIPAEKYVWYRVHGPVTEEEAEDFIQIEFSKIEKGSNSCDQRIATIEKI